MSKLVLFFSEKDAAKGDFKRVEGIYNYTFDSVYDGLRGFIRFRGEGAGKARVTCDFFDKETGKDKTLKVTAELKILQPGDKNHTRRIYSWRLPKVICSVTGNSFSFDVIGSGAVMVETPVGNFHAAFDYHDYLINWEEFI